MSRTLKTQQRAEKIALGVGLMTFNEKVGELGFFNPGKRRHRHGLTAACICVRGNWRDDEDKPFLVDAGNIMGQQLQIMAWEAQISLMFKAVTKS